MPLMKRYSPENTVKSLKMRQYDMMAPAHYPYAEHEWKNFS